MKAGDRLLVPNRLLFADRLRTAGWAFMPPQAGAAGVRTVAGESGESQREVRNY